jgi:hypothetical protein
MNNFIYLLRAARWGAIWGAGLFWVLFASRSGNVYAIALAIVGTSFYFYITNKAVISYYQVNYKSIDQSWKNRFMHFLYPFLTAFIVAVFVYGAIYG